MKALPSLLLLVLTAFTFGQTSSQPARPCIGSLSELRGTVELRPATSGPARTLDPRTDRHLPIYLGDQVRCANDRSYVKITRLFGQDFLHTSVHWTNVPQAQLPTDPSTRSIVDYAGAQTRPAGRTRGQEPARRAFLVGIDKYRSSPAGNNAEKQIVTASSAARVQPTRGNWIDLDGSVNDVLAIRELLLARFGFSQQDILVLTNEMASRQAILDQLQNHLLSETKPGDIAFFYYAGHGSQVMNTGSDEVDQRDETIVPADSISGAPDIRDKELRRIFNAILFRGAQLTAILDSCHSGSISRGHPVELRSRFLEPMRGDLKDHFDPGPNPKTNGFGALIISAALPSQEAAETKDAHGITHGVFSMALVRALRSSDPNESAERLFLRAKASMQSEGRLQEPVLDGNSERVRGTLWGSPAARTGTSVAVLSTSGKEVGLQGGAVLGINPGSELKKKGQTGNEVRLKVTKSEGAVRAIAEVIAGSPQEIQPGDLFELVTWVSPDAASLRLWMPPSYAGENLAERATAFKQHCRAVGINWINDPTMDSPTHVLSWDGTRWLLKDAGTGKERALGSELNEGLARQLQAENGKAIRLFLNAPPLAEIASKLASTPPGNMEYVKIASEAHYLLCGRITESGIEYAWMLPNTTVADAERSVLPSRTDWHKHPSRTPVSEVLAVSAFKLARLRGWLQLESPPDARFPYHLVLKNKKTGAENDGRDAVREGEEYELLLKAPEDSLAEGVPKHFVYVFLIDAQGRSTLLFPNSGGNDENQFPLAQPAPAQIRLPSAALKIQPPFGIDNYFLLATREALPNPYVLELDGVRTRGRPRSGLGNLLEANFLGTRGAQPTAPSDWFIQRTPIQCLSK